MNSGARTRGTGTHIRFERSCKMEAGHGSTDIGYGNVGRSGDGKTLILNCFENGDGVVVGEDERHLPSFDFHVPLWNPESFFASSLSCSPPYKVWKILFSLLFSIPFFVCLKLTFFLRNILSERNSSGVACFCIEIYQKNWE